MSEETERRRRHRYRWLRDRRTEISLALCGIGCAFLVAALVAGLNGSDVRLALVAATMLAGVLFLGAAAAVPSIRLSSRPRSKKQPQRD